MADAKKCDVCGKYYMEEYRKILYKQTARECYSEIRIPLVGGMNANYDLCSDCFHKITEIILPSRPNNEEEPMC